MVEQKDLILKEIDIVHSEIARYDSNGLRVKGWCLAVWAALIAYGVQHHNAFIVAAASVTTGCFALVELMYRRFQLRFIARSEHIEEMLASKSFGQYMFDIHNYAIGRRTDSRFLTEARKVLLQPHFFVFYLLLVVLALACVGYTYCVSETPLLVRNLFCCLALLLNSVKIFR